MRELLLAERHASEVHAPFAGGHFGQCAPAAANFEQALVVPRREVDHAQRPAHFGVLRLGHGQHGVAIEPGRRVVHGLVQPQAVEGIAQVVMGMDVFAAVGACVAVEPMAQAVRQLAPPAAVNHGLQRVAVGNEHAQQGAQIGGFPFARDERLGKANVAAAHGGGKHAPVVHHQAGAGVFAVAVHRLAAIGQAQVQAAVLEFLQQGQHPACGQGHVGGQAVLRRGGGVHRFSSAQRVTNSEGRCGLGTYGMRCHHSFKACQWMRVITPQVIKG